MQHFVVGLYLKVYILQMEMSLVTGNSHIQVSYYHLLEKAMGGTRLLILLAKWPIFFLQDQTLGISTAAT